MYIHLANSNNYDYIQVTLSATYVYIYQGLLQYFFITMSVICEMQKHDKTRQKIQNRVILEVDKLFPYSLGYYILEMYDPGPRCLIMSVLKILLY